MRGEHGGAIAEGEPPKESSPHARGALGLARAAMGEGGSSPHARGAHVGAIKPIVQVGIIPACAGSTRFRA